MTFTTKKYLICVDNSIVARTNSFQTAKRLLLEYAKETSHSISILNTANINYYSGRSNLQK